MITLKEHNVKPYGELCAMLAKEQKCAYVAATGTGKSYVVGKYIEDYGYEQDTLVLLPNNAIKNGWKNILPKIHTMTYTALSRKPIDAKKYKVIVCDEMHHLGAILWGRICREVMEGFDGIIIGISATPIRFLDQCRDMTIEFFDGNVVEGLDLPQAISAGILPSFEYVSSLFNMPSFTPSQRDKITDSLVERLDFMNSVYSFKSILRKHLGDGNHKVAVFASYIGKIEEIKELCSEVFPDASHYIFHSKLKKTESRKALEDFSQDSNMSFIYTVDMLSEGVHIKGVDCVIMFRKTESPILYLQQLGRAMNTDMAGKRVKILDFVANHTNLKVLQENGTSVLEWVRSGISNPKSQIVVSDYTVKEMELLDKINMILKGRWLPEEEALVIEKYNSGKGLDELVELLPDKSRQAIMQRALRLGVAGQKEHLREKGLDEAVKELYLKENGVQLIQERFPGVTLSYIRKVANIYGLYKNAPLKRWTSEEDEMLIEMDADGVSLEEQGRRLGRTEKAVGSRRTVLGINREKHVWTEEEDKILLETEGMSGNEVKEKYFPNIHHAAINKRRIKLGMTVDKRWSEERKKLFDQLYTEGGMKAVHENESFSSMTAAQIYGRAGGRKLKSGNTGNPWTEEEDEALKEYILMPTEKRPSFAQYCKRLTRHSQASAYTRYKKMEKEIKQ